MEKVTIFEKSRPGRCGYVMPGNDVTEQPLDKLIPAKYLRCKPAELPEVDEVTIVRHYTNLSKKNVGVDTTFYPLGSCTMKYNPKVNETLAGLAGFAGLHPYQPAETIQGILEILDSLGNYLKEISGLSAVTLQPAAGAHGEFTGIKIIRAALKDSGNPRRYILIPDSAHGTNPASVVFSGYEPIEVKSDPRGNVDLTDLKRKLNPEVAGLMLTIPNTLGLFDEHIKEMADLVHQNGSYLYMDGANLNALVGLTTPGLLGVDVLHFNLHKTFATPHGGGGPGAGAVAVTEKLTPYLPIPRLKKVKNRFVFDDNYPKSIGRIKGFYGNIAVLVKAYIYIRMLGPEGLRKMSQTAVLNANYLLARLKNYYHLPYDRPCMHECVFSGQWQAKRAGVHTLDIAKRLIDYGFHPPTIYFPLIVPEAIMIEPTETEGKETLDEFAEVMIKIAGESEKTPNEVKSAPHHTPVKRLDEVRAARQPILRWKKSGPPDV